MKCHVCKSPMEDNATRCGECGATPTAHAAGPRCVHCGTGMSKGKKANKNMGLQVLGVFLFFFAVYLLQFVPFGTVGGIVLMLVAMNLGYSKVSGWKCSSCGYFFERS